MKVTFLVKSPEIRQDILDIFEEVSRYLDNYGKLEPGKSHAFEEASRIVKDIGIEIAQ